MNTIINILEAWLKIVPIMFVVVGLVRFIVCGYTGFILIFVAQFLHLITVHFWKSSKLRFEKKEISQQNYVFWLCYISVMNAFAVGATIFMFCMFTDTIDISINLYNSTMKYLIHLIHVGLLSIRQESSLRSSCDFVNEQLKNK